MALKRRPTTEETPVAPVETPNPYIAPSPAAATSNDAVPPVTAAPAPVEATTVPAVRQAAPVAPMTMPVKGSMKLLWEDKKDLFIAEFGELPRIKAGSGNLVDGDNKDLGRWIEIQLLSYNAVYVVGPGDKDAPKELVRYSSDNETFDDGTGETVAEHLADLRVNWPNASSKMYYEVIGALRASEKPSEHLAGMVQIQFSPTSVTAFEGYKKQASFKIAMGQMDPAVADLCRIEATSVSNKQNNWTKLVPKSTQL